MQDNPEADKDPDTKDESPVILKHSLKSVLAEDPIELMRNQVANSRSPATWYAQSRALKLLEQHLAGGHISTQMIADFLERGNALYQNITQYHTSEHMFNVVADAVRLAGVAGVGDQDRLLALVVAAAYHDVGNGRHPEEVAGVDELEAAEILLCDIGDQLRGTETILGPSPLLRTLSPGQIVTSVCAILGTVMLDRFCVAGDLYERKYIENGAQLLADFAAEFYSVDEMLRAGAEVMQVDVYRLCRESLRELLAEGIGGQITTLLKNADIFSSLTTSYIFKNHITNRYEDREKSFVKGKTCPRAYSAGFLSFLRGGFHSYPKAIAALEKAQKGFPFLGHDLNLRPGFESTDTVEALGFRMLADMEARWNEILDQHYGIISSLHILIDTGVEIPALTIPLIGENLLEQNQDLASYQLLTDYRKLDELEEGGQELPFVMYRPESLDKIFIPE